MPDPVMIIRGLPSPYETATAQEAMVGDLKLIALLSDQQVSEIRQRLAEATGFLDPKALLEAICATVADSKSAEAVRRAVRFFEMYDPEQVLNDLKQDDKNQDLPFDRLRSMLSELAKPFPALARFRKAEQLAGATGQQLEELQLICDLRPLFDSERKQVEGLMPYTRLRIVAKREDGLPEPFEIELTNEQVVDLASKAGKAKSKLETLRASVDIWLPEGLPDLPLTRIPEEPTDA